MITNASFTTLNDNLHLYKYESLICKKDLIIKEYKFPVNVNQKSRKKDIITFSKLYAIKQANALYTEKGLIVHNNDLDIDIIIGSSGLRHGLETRKSNYNELIIATINIGEIMQNAIAVNELEPRTINQIGAIVFTNAIIINKCVYIIRVIVSENISFDFVDVFNLTAINTKDGAQGLQALKAPSTLSIKDFINYCKNIPIISGTFSKDVKNRIGICEVISDLENIKY